MKNFKTPVINKKLKALLKDITVIKETMVTKSDFDQKFQRLAVEIVRNGHDIKELKDLKTSVSAIQDNGWLIMDRIDAFARKVDVVDKKDLVHDHRINELEPKVEDHEKRLISLETSG